MKRYVFCFILSCSYRKQDFKDPRLKNSWKELLIRNPYMKHYIDEP